MKKELTRLFSVLLAAVLVFGTLPVSALGTDVADPPASAVDESAVDESSAEPEEQSAVDDAAQPEEQSAEEENVAVQAANDTSYDYNIFFLDCGRKYYSVDSIKKLIDNASAAGFNYVQLAVGNDGLRLLLDDMSLTVGDNTYSSEAVSNAIHAGNVNYDTTGTDTEGNLLNYKTDTDELTQAEMDEIIAYAGSKNMGVIPCVNSPGHMDAILYAAESLTGETLSYNGSVRTIDVTNDIAVAFTKALLQKYIDYFAGEGCQLFNMGADEYANDKYLKAEDMGFGQLKADGDFGSFVTYVNDVAAMIKNAKMTPMAFNDGINYYEDSVSFDTDIVVCYWSNGWSNYHPKSAEALAKDFKLINTHGDYYWVLGKTDAQCSSSKASQFNYKSFQGGTISNPSGSMFCIWADYPGAETEKSVISKTADTISAFGKTLPVAEHAPVLPDNIYITDNLNGGKLTVGGEMVLRANKTVDWETSNEAVASIRSADEDGVSTQSAPVNAQAITVTAGEAGTATITATSGDKTKTYDVTVEEPGTKNITVAVYADDNSTEVDGNYPGPFVTDDETIAKVTTSVTTIEGKTSLEAASLGDGTFYISTSRNATTTPSSQLTFEEAGDGKYYIKNTDGQYIYPKATYSNWKWNYSLGYEKQAVDVKTSGTGITISADYSYEWWGYTQKTTAYLRLNNTSYGVNGSSQTLYLYTTVTTEATYKTTITFHGVSEGTTSVTIGGVTYNIEVTEEDLDAVTPLEIEYWITNQHVTANDVISQQVLATAEGIHTEDGVEISTLVPAEGKSEVNHDAVFKQARMLDATKTNSSKSETELQTKTSGDNETRSGTQFTKIRYWGGKWQAYTDQWTDIDTTNVNVRYPNGKNTSGTTIYENYTGARHQLVAYYMQRTDVTQEATTDVTDWGDSVGAVHWTGYVELDFAVKYENGLRSPNTFPVAGKTMEFHCDYSTELDNTVFKDGNTYYRTIDRIDAVNTSDYEVYMITLTPTSDTKTEQLTDENGTTRPSSWTYGGTEKVAWVDDEANLGDFADESLHADGYRVGGDPTLDSVNIYLRQGLLVTYYVRAKASKDSLSVRYVDKTTGIQFYDYNIVVNGGITFAENIALPNTDKKKGNLVNGTVTNSLKQNITVSSDLSTMPAIGANYRYSEYDVDSMDLSEDHKIVTIYYTFTNAVSFVVDFGTPLTIKPEDLNAELKNAKINNVTVTNQTHGNATVDPETHNITYTPDTRFVSSKAGETLQVAVTGEKTVNGKLQTDTVTYQVYIYPASNVFYEENFLDNSLDTDNRWKNVDPAESAKVTAAQETQKVDDKTYNVFGYDGSYNASVGENGVWHVDDLEPNQPTKALTTSFYGNTFDLIGDCGYDTGRVLLLVKNDDNTKVKLTIIDTRYNDGKDAESATLSQVPLAHVVMGKDDTYKVMVYASGLDASNTVSAQAVATESMDDAYVVADDEIAAILEENGLTADQVEITTTSVMDESGAVAPAMASAVAVYDGETSNEFHGKGTHVEIDGFRVYRSTDTENDAVAKNYPANEQNVTYHNILDVVKGEIVAYTELDNGNTPIRVEEYEANGGPQNEIYLTKGQFVYFQSSDLANKEIQVSLRSVNTNATASVKDTKIELKSNTEMYYTIKADENGRVTIANNNNDGLLAIGNVKLPSGVTTDEIQSASEAGDEAVIAALKAVLNTNVEPEVFTPETFTVKTTSTKVIRNKVVTLKINVSSDVAYVTINGVKYTRTGLQGMFQKTRTIRAVYTVPKNDEKTYEIIAYNADGVASEAITKTVK